MPFYCFSLIWSIGIGDAVVQNGATSIVGQCIIQLARVRGIHSINIIRDRCPFVSLKLVSPHLHVAEYDCLIFICQSSMRAFLN